MDDSRRVITRPLALVTGAASGIGRAIVERFVREEISVVALDRDEAELNRFVSLLQAKRLWGCLFDLSDTSEIPALISRLTSDHGSITILVNNAGAWYYEPLVDIPEDRWEHIFKVNVTAPFLLTREVGKRMIDLGEGSIVNISSRNAIVSSKGSSAYDSSKAALSALTRTAAGEFAEQGIRVNAICPGVIDTPANADLLADHEALDNYLKLIPTRRFGEPEDIAGIVHFLTTDDSKFITGQTIVADGGQMTFSDWKRLFE